MPTPHLSAEAGDFAPTVLMPGDPRRAARIATNFLDDTRQVTDVRAMSGFTGSWRSTPISVMPSGMGIPSAAIYITELVREFGVRRIIRVGTTGAYQPDLAVRDIVAAEAAVTNSNFPSLIGASEPLTATPTLVNAARQAAAEHDVALRVGTVLTSDVFYEPDDSSRDTHAAAGVLCVEMECAALYSLAQTEGFEALTLLTVTDHLVTHERLSSDERQQGVDQMISVALDLAASLD